MSKIGQQSIEVLSGVSIEIKDNLIKIKGPNGEKSLLLPVALKVNLKDGKIFIERLSDEKRIKAQHGLYRQLLANFIKGVIKPWEKRLELVGTGYNVKLQGEDLVLKLGFSHPIVFKKQEGVKYQVIGNNIIVIMGIDKQLVGQVAYQIRSLKKPDVYKGKGIRYLGEKVRIKPGKKAKGAEGVTK